VGVCVCLHFCAYISLYVHVYVCMCVRVYAPVSVCTFLCAYMCVYLSVSAHPWWEGFPQVESWGPALSKCVCAWRHAHRNAQSDPESSWSTGKRGLRPSQAPHLS
jgi:hypothetical protein